MIQRIQLKAMVFRTVSGFTALGALLTCSSALAQDLTPLRACARALSINVEGDRFYEGFSSEKDDSMYFITCDSDYTKGRDHYILTDQGAYHLFEKSHKDYQGGMIPTHYRFNLNQETYYFKSNIVGEMGDVFDAQGRNLFQKPITGETKIDISSKNKALAFYMKTLTGSSDPKAALKASPVTPERNAILQSCLRSKLSYMGNSLQKIYLARFRDIDTDLDELANYRKNTVKALSEPACYSDPELGSKFNELMVNLP
jgi:hypothetical protein